MKTFYKRYERFFLPTFLIGGFFVDLLTFRYMKPSTQFVVLGVYAFLSACAILFLHNPRVYPKLEHKRLLRLLRAITPPALQFFFGALLSSALLFYWFSGAFSVSWPLVLFVALLAGGNEAFREHYLRPIVQIPLFFFMVFSFFTLVFPFVVHSIEPWVFYSSGTLALALMWAYVKDFCRFNNVKTHQRKYLLLSILAIYAGMNGLYLLRVLPPIPLSIREADIYHTLVKTSDGYRLSREDTSFIDRILPGQTLHLSTSSPLYAFTSIFAPSRLSTQIVHRWERYDSTTKQWEDQGAFSYTLSGGRQDGYRGYTYKTSPKEGRWRVSVETTRGQVLGRIHFRVTHTPNPVPLVEVIK